MLYRLVHSIALSSACLMLLVAFADQARGASAVEPGQTAFYLVASSEEGGNPPVEAVRIDIDDTETVGESTWIWWELTARLFKGDSYGIRILSERAPMTSPDGVGEIARYIFRDSDGRTFEYWDETHETALLPAIQFRSGFLPQVSRYTRYRDGFATAGTFLGHILAWMPEVDDLERVDIGRPERLELRTDLLMMTHSQNRHFENNRSRRWTREETARMIDAGMNLVIAQGNAEEPDWTKDWYYGQPAFFRTAAEYPEGFYRSNWYPTRAYLDEPATRMDGKGRMPRHTIGPEQPATSLTMDIQAEFTLEERKIELPRGTNTGTLDLYEEPGPVWETQYWSAWYQMAAGASGFVHEGRYVDDTYGWHVSTVFGDDVYEGVRLNEQLNFMYGFMRGAARAWDGHWGTAIYRQSDPDYRLPAMTYAYDQGARYLWFWNSPEINYDEKLRLVRGVMRHIRHNPRGDLETVNKRAKVAIVLPESYLFNWWGTWSHTGDQLFENGATFRDVSAAGAWEAILCSLKGIPFDIVHNEPVVDGLGYERLIRIHPDGTSTVSPPWPETRAPEGLRLEITDEAVAGVIDRVTENVDYTAQRMDDVNIDGDLIEWEESDWIELRPDPHGFADVHEFETALEVVNSVTRWRIQFHNYQGMKYYTVNEDYEEQFNLEGFQGKGLVLTEVEPDSPADKAGLRAGDVLVEMRDTGLVAAFQLNERIETWYQPTEGERLSLVVQRSAQDDFGGPGDITAEVAFRVGEDHLYFAADITDNIHSQRHDTWGLWQGDSIEIGLDPTMERRFRDYWIGGYGEEDHELLFTLKDGEPVVVRSYGRDGLTKGEIDTVDAAIVRDGDRTRYEVAIPFEELMPLSPDMWPQMGFDVVVNDSDGTWDREGRLELVYEEKAMTMGPGPEFFEVMEFEPSTDQDKLSAAFLWRQWTARESEAFRVIAAVASPEVREARLIATLRSLDDPLTNPQVATLTLPVTPEPAEHSVRIGNTSNAGRYQLTLQVEDPQGQPVFEDTRTVWIYPEPATEALVEKE